MWLPQAATPGEKNTLKYKLIDNPMYTSRASTQTFIFSWWLPKLAVAAWSCLAVAPKVLVQNHHLLFWEGWLEAKALITWHSITWSNGKIWYVPSSGLPDQVSESIIQFPWVGSWPMFFEKTEFWMPRKLAKTMRIFLKDRTHQKPGGHILTGKNRTSISHAIKWSQVQSQNQDWTHDGSIVWEILVRFFLVKMWTPGFRCVLSLKIFSRF